MQMSAYFVSAGNLHPEFLSQFLKQWEDSVMTMSLVMNLWVSLTKCDINVPINNSDKLPWLCWNSQLLMVGIEGIEQATQNFRQTLYKYICTPSFWHIYRSNRKLSLDVTSTQETYLINKLSNKFVALFLLSQRNTGCSPYDMLT